MVRGRPSETGTRPRHGGGTKEGKERHEAVLAQSAFPAIRRFTQTWGQRTSIDDLVGRMLSMSSTAPAVLGGERIGLETDLREALIPFAVDGLVEEALEAAALVASRR